MAGRLRPAGPIDRRGVGAPGALSSPAPATVARPWPVPGRMILSAPEVPCALVGRPDGPWQLQGRSGKWEVIDRQGFRGITAWRGYSLLRITGKLLLDAWLTDDGDVVDELRVLAKMERKVDDDQTRRPPWLYLAGVLPVLPEDADPRWVIETMTIEEVAGYHREDGRCARAVADLTFLEFVDPDIAITVDLKATARTIGKTYRWREHDTLQGVAKRELGDARKTDAIRQANPKIKAFSKVKPGDPIQIPPRASA